MSSQELSARNLSVAKLGIERKFIEGLSRDVMRLIDNRTKLSLNDIVKEYSSKFVIEQNSTNLSNDEVCGSIIMELTADLLLENPPHNGNYRLGMKEYDILIKYRQINGDVYYTVTTESKVL